MAFLSARSQYSRPKKSAVVFNVPCSASNRSIRGVRQMMLTSICRKPVCIKGKVFSRYTGRAKSQSVQSFCKKCHAQSKPRSLKRVPTGSETDLFRYQRAPLCDTPHGLKFHDPED